jgi:hypothetical protein
MTTTLLAVVVMLLALLALRLIGRVLGLVLRLALLALLAAVLLLAFASRQPHPIPPGPDRRAPRPAMVHDAPRRLPGAPGPPVLTGRLALSLRAGLLLTG